MGGLHCIAPWLFISPWASERESEEAKRRKNGMQIRADRSKKSASICIYLRPAFICVLKELLPNPLPARHQVDDAHLGAVGDGGAGVAIVRDQHAVDGDDELAVAVLQSDEQLTDGELLVPRYFFVLVDGDHGWLT